MGAVKQDIRQARLEAQEDRRRKAAAEAAQLAQLEQVKPTTVPEADKPTVVAIPESKLESKFEIAPVEAIEFPEARDEELGAVQLLGIAHQVWALAIPVSMLSLITIALAYQFVSIVGTYVPATVRT